jgi:hypothetical protein
MDGWVVVNDFFTFAQKRSWEVHSNATTSAPLDGWMDGWMDDDIESILSYLTNYVQKSF